MSLINPSFTLSEVDLISATLQLLQYVGSIGAVGSILLMFSLRTSTTTAKTESFFWKQAAVGATLLLLIEPIRLSQLLFNLFDQDWSLALSEDGFGLLTEISTGQAGLLRIAAASILLLFVWRQWLSFAVIPATLILLSYLITGHTASYDPDVPSVAPFILTTLLLAHLLILHWWIAIIYPLLKLVQNRDPQAIKISHSFGWQAAISVPILMIAGGLLLAILVDWKIDLGQGYQAWFLIKLIFVGCILFVAALNKFRFGKNLNTHSDFKAFAFSLRIEMCIALLILMATSLAINVGLDM